MAYIVDDLYQTYNNYTYEFLDERVRHYYFIDPAYLISIITVYALFVNKYGREFMKGRQPYQLNKLIILYNLFQVVINGYVFVFSSPILWNADLRCVQPYEGSSFVHFFYIYYLSKYLDLFDTVFFILRKRYNQISLLHIYHHTSMPIWMWITFTYFPGGQSIFVPYINSFVHMVMYYYYYITARDAKQKNNVKWKKYLTQLQLLQFVIGFLIYTQPVLRPSCLYNKVWSAGMAMNNIVFMTMFGNFYYKSYIKKAKVC